MLQKDCFNECVIANFFYYFFYKQSNYHYIFFFYFFQMQDNLKGLQVHNYSLTFTWPTFNMQVRSDASTLLYWWLTAACIFYLQSPPSKSLSELLYLISFIHNSPLLFPVQAIPYLSSRFWDSDIFSKFYFYHVKK